MKTGNSVSPTEGLNQDFVPKNLRAKCYNRSKRVQAIAVTHRLTNEMLYSKCKK